MFWMSSERVGLQNPRVDESCGEKDRTCCLYKLKLNPAITADEILSFNAKKSPTNTNDGFCKTLDTRQPRYRDSKTVNHVWILGF